MIPKLNSNKIVNNVKTVIESNKMKSEKTYNEYLYEMIENIAKRTEREVPEYGDFAPVVENFANKNDKLSIGKYQIKIFKMPKADVNDEKQRFIEASVYPKAGDYKADMLLYGGNKENILTELKSKNFPQKLNDAYIKLVDMIENPA